LRSHPSISDLRQSITAAPTKDLAGISVHAVGGDPSSTAALANAVGTAYQQVTAERAAQDAHGAIAAMKKIEARLQAELDAIPTSPDGTSTSRQRQLSAQITDLQQREQDISTQASVFASGVELFERAELPTSPTSPKPKLYALLGAVLGLLIATAWAWWAAARRQRAEGWADPARILRAPLLGEVPQLRARDLRALPQTSAADAYRSVVASLRHQLAGVGGSSVVLTSVTPDENKTSTTLRIANAALEQDLKTLLIDADDRTRRLSQLCGVLDKAPGGRNGRGPMSVKADEALEAKEFARCLVLTRSGMVVPATPNGSGPGHRSTPVRAPQVHQALRSVGKQFDLVLIDAPALLPASDALSVAGQADGVMLVVNHGVLLSQLRDVTERLAFTSTPLVGYVYVRPTGTGIRRTLWEHIRTLWEHIRTLWERTIRRRGNGGIGKIVTGPDPVKVAEGGSELDKLAPAPRVSPRRRRRTSPGSADSRPAGSGHDA
jgi:Mrp family chromosome partitioning ATPase/capsular polysaccharide biosynthesis protein